MVPGIPQGFPPPKTCFSEMRRLPTTNRNPTNFQRFKWEESFVNNGCGPSLFETLKVPDMREYALYRESRREEEARGGEEEAGRVQLRAFESLGRSGFSYNTLLMTMTIFQPQKCGVETRFYFHLFYSDPIWRLEPNFLVNYSLHVCNTISISLVLDY